MRRSSRWGLALAGLLAGGVSLAAALPVSFSQTALSVSQVLVSSGPASSSRVSSLTPPQRLAAQQAQPSSERDTEVVANLATGRVYILITKNGIIVGVAGAPAEPGSLPPRIVQLADRKLAVLLGAVDWQDPVSGKQLASFASELGHLRPLSGVAPPQLNRESTEGPAADIEVTGLGVFEKLRGLAEMLHGPLQLGRDQSALQIILTDFVEDYGPEVWTVDYSFTQEELRIGSDYWETHVTRPRYMQLWPPEKGQPHSLVVLGYPAAEGGAAAQAELLHAADAAESQAAVAEVKQAISAGDTRKLDANHAVTFMRAALSSLGGGTGNFAIAAIGEKTGFAWIVKQSAPAGIKKQRPPGAPSLIKP
jgi:hypothetical protein